jgi:demethylmenaquinone methyltransferase/2-methoxy-6-polyprenyl-1,4-benzoquinol methylase
MLSSQSPIRAADPETVREMFSTIAARYDVTNALLSFGLHRLWNRRLAKTVLTRSPSKILDLCCGTGAIAHELLKRCGTQSAQVTCADFCPSMLTHATAKLAPWARLGHQLQYLCADAQSLPLPEQAFDAVTIAYGIRNVADPLRALAEAHRVLRPGGQIAVLELTRPQMPWLSWAHRGYLKVMVPLLGALSTRQKAAYQYLARSIRQFTDPAVLAQHMQQIGFHRVHQQPLWGGVCTLITGIRKSES